MQPVPNNMPERPESRPAIQTARPMDKIAIMAAISSISAVGMALGLSFPLLSILMEYKGYSKTLIGANSAIAALAGLVIIPFTTQLARRFGLVNTLVVASILGSLSLIGFFFFQSNSAWFVLRFLLHLTITVFFVLSEFWINASVDPARRGLVLGIYATVLCAGFALGPALLVWTTSQGILPFAVGAMIILVSVVPALFARSREPKLESVEETGKVSAYLIAVPAATLGVFVFGFAEQASNALLPILALNNNYPESAAALLLMALGFGNVALQIPLGLWADRLISRGYNHKPLLLLCAISGAIGAIAIPFIISNPILLYLDLFIWGGVTAGLYTLGLAHLGARIKGISNLAQANAAFSLSYVLGMLSGPQLSGIAMDFYPATGFTNTIATAFACYAAFLLVREKLFERK